MIICEFAVDDHFDYAVTECVYGLIWLLADA